MYNNRSTVRNTMYIVGDFPRKALIMPVGSYRYRGAPVKVERSGYERLYPVYKVLIDRHPSAG